MDDAGSRLFHWNLLAAALMILAWISLRFPERTRLQALQKIFFRRKYWWNRSTRVDYGLYLLNGVLRILIFVPFLDFSFWFSSQVSRGLYYWYSESPQWSPEVWAIVPFTAAVFVWDDFLRFFHHYLMHKVPWLWRFHSVHHSARILTPVTLFRAHPVEVAMATVRNSLSLGIASGIFVFLFQSPLNLWTLFGVNAFGFVFNLLGSNLRHSHIPLSFGPWLETLFISPVQHQIHHSRNLEDRDKNLGVSLSVWDALMGSLVKAHSRPKRVSSFARSL